MEEKTMKKQISMLLATACAASLLAACGGSWICEPALIQSSEWEEIGRRTREALRAL